MMKEGQAEDTTPGYGALLDHNDKALSEVSVAIDAITECLGDLLVDSGPQATLASAEAPVPNLSNVGQRLYGQRRLVHELVSRLHELRHRIPTG